MKLFSCPKKQKLSDFPTGKEGILRTLQTPKNPEILRLLEMGMVDGTPITLLRRGPFGTPLHVLVCGTQLCLRKKEASLFFVQWID